MEFVRNIPLKIAECIVRAVAAEFQKRSILFEKYNFGFRSIFFGPISVQLSNFHCCFCNTDASAETGDFLKRYIWSEKHISAFRSIVSGDM